MYAELYAGLCVCNICTGLLADRCVLDIDGRVSNYLCTLGCKLVLVCDMYTGLLMGV